eukprot:6491714-Amphidinium_carterae.2
MATPATQRQQQQAFNRLKSCVSIVPKQVKTIFKAQPNLVKRILDADGDATVLSLWKSSLVRAGFSSDVTALPKQNGESKPSPPPAGVEATQSAPTNRWKAAETQPPQVEYKLRDEWSVPPVSKLRGPGIMILPGGASITPLVRALGRVQGACAILSSSSDTQEGITPVAVSFCATKRTFVGDKELSSQLIGMSGYMYQLGTVNVTKKEAVKTVKLSAESAFRTAVVGLDMYEKYCDEELYKSARSGKLGALRDKLAETCKDEVKVDDVFALSRSARSVS